MSTLIGCRLKPILQLEFNSTNDNIVSASASGHLDLFDVKGERKIASLEGKKEEERKREKRKRILNTKTIQVRVRVRLQFGMQRNVNTVCYINSNMICSGSDEKEREKERILMQ